MRISHEKRMEKAIGAEPQFMAMIFGKDTLMVLLKISGGRHIYEGSP